MPNLNRVMLMGNLTRDPELRYLPSNTPVVNIGVAVNRRWRNQQGEQQEETTFVDCEAFGRTAELLNQYLRKGRPIFIEGRLKYEQWQDREGHNRSKLRVVVENFQFVDSRGGDDQGGPGGGYAAGGGYATSGGSRRVGGTGGSGGSAGGYASGDGNGYGSSNSNSNSNSGSNSEGEAGPTGGDHPGPSSNPVDSPHMDSGTTTYTQPKEDDIPF